jgi:hypothetical protein
VLWSSASGSFHIIVISRDDNRGADDCEPHICLLGLFWQATIAIQIRQLNLPLPILLPHVVGEAVFSS